MFPSNVTVSHKLSKMNKRLGEKLKARASLSGEMTLSSPSHGGLESSKEKRDRQKKVLRNQWMEIFQI